MRGCDEGCLLTMWYQDETPSSAEWYIRTWYPFARRSIARISVLQEVDIAMIRQTTLGRSRRTTSLIIRLLMGGV